MKTLVTKPEIETGDLERINDNQVAVLGFDISTSVTAMTLLAHGPRLIAMGHTELSRVDGFWPKIDAFKVDFVEFLSCLSVKPTHVFVEESLQAFRTGFSSATTLMTLAKFNGIASSIIRDHLGITPVPIAAMTARKLCGIRTVHGRSAKIQAFEQITGVNGPLAGHQFPTKRGGIAPKDWAYDEVDSFVVAWAGLHSLSQI